MSWWWAIVFLFVGAMIGVFVMGLCAINSEDRHGKKWWEDDE